MSPRTRPVHVATGPAGVYPPRMPTPRMMRFLIMLALILMPLGMLVGGPADSAPHHASVATAMDHCAGMDKQRKKAPGHCADCAIACAALPSRADGVEIPAVMHAVLASPASIPAIHGLHPEAATPPPRFA